MAKVIKAAMPTQVKKSAAAANPKNAESKANLSKVFGVQKK